jgi:hypothetical protein
LPVWRRFQRPVGRKPAMDSHFTRHAIPRIVVLNSTLVEYMDELRL